MSQDLQAYSTMTALNKSLTSSDDTYYSMSDEAEAARLQAMSASQGLGDFMNVYDEEDTGFLQDMGIKIEQEQ